MYAHNGVKESWKKLDDTRASIHVFSFVVSMNLEQCGFMRTVTNPWHFINTARTPYNGIALKKKKKILYVYE